MITSALYLVLPGAAIVAAMMLFFGASTSRLGLWSMLVGPRA